MLIAAKLIKFVEVPLDGATVAHPFNVKYAGKFLETAIFAKKKCFGAKIVMIRNKHSSLRSLICDVNCFFICNIFGVRVLIYKRNIKKEN